MDSDTGNEQLGKKDLGMDMRICSEAEWKQSETIHYAYSTCHKLQNTLPYLIYSSPRS